MPHKPAPASAPAPTTRHLRRLLELLATGAPAEDLGTVAAQARRDGAGPEDLAEIDRAVDAALRVQSTLRQHRRREAELTALFDTAGDLAALRDLDAVLRAIVRRARQLLGTDTAYLTLPDEEAGDTFMRVTDGSVSGLFQNLRLQLGEGLGGLVAQTARPYATPDYRTDDRFLHTGSIDAGVLDEGLVAILGVPLLLGSGSGGQVIGALFAADRTPRAFAPDEVALLCSLADHAAIAIDTAKAMADTRAALAGLAEANAVIGEHSAAVQRAEESHDRLTDLVLRGGDVSDVATAVAGLLKGDVAVHDGSGWPLATVGGPDGAPVPAGRRDGVVAERDGAVGGRDGVGGGRTGVVAGRDGVVGASGEDRSGVRAAALVAAAEDSRSAARAVFRDGRWVCAMLAGQELLGCLVLDGRPDLTGPDQRLFERSSVVTSLLLLLRRSVAETENRVRGDLLTDLLAAPRRDPDGLVARGRRLGFDLDRPHLLLLARTADEARGRLADAAVRHLFGTGGVSAEHQDAVVLLLPDEGRTPGEAARLAAGQLGRLVGAPVTVAGTGPAAGPGAIADAHTEGTRCLRALGVLDRTGQGAGVAELGFLGVLLGDDHDVDGFVTRTLGPLLEYDARRGTRLLPTLRAYFDCGGSLTRAKDALHVHVNTVVQRLDRVQALLGADWNAPEQALELQLALRLHLLSGS
ncbi:MULTISPECIES: helix-turn-helix domain-containing protein [Streptomyces]|uniref:Helix-turn-helix domain-containing protein n=1 Tax=Streptomyces doudnae TaxID=3075536 RepID=A0ABD5EYS6_9ACTN|nr:MULTISPECIES: GAF domain-containing protein [unclassified Streptomyces]MDT0439470.1 helix-turn-helix domain-containing protein [Streptomyces sp. DSM 41981]MYQ69296.1 GAF domain-containing protein [Streptomyces sp. SID4950]SCE52713.1 GAF domain-containing protein [Streptomyces sp. SolWspMP-5a-2]